jgi:hypothetical protein
MTSGSAGHPVHAALLEGFAEVTPLPALQVAEHLIYAEDAHDLSLSPIVTTAADALDLYGLRLRNSEITGHQHQGLPQLVASLGRLDGCVEVRVRHIAAALGLVSLVTDSRGTPIGLVALPNRGP